MKQLTLILITVGLLLIGLFAIGLIYFNSESNTGYVSGNVYRSDNGSLVITSNVPESESSSNGSLVIDLMVPELEDTVVLQFNQKSTPLFHYAYSKSIQVIT